MRLALSTALRKRVSSPCRAIADHPLPRHRTALLVLQGENDGRCPRGQSEELFAHLIRCTQAPVELVVYPDSTHAEADSGRPSNRADYHARVAPWAERWANGDQVGDDQGRRPPA